jgi:hypothetical protein
MELIKRFAIALICCVVSTMCFAEPMKLKTPRGASIEVIAEFPAGDGSFPTVILALSYSE